MTALPKAGLTALHCAVLLFGLAGLFGKWLSSPPMILVAGRTLFATLALSSFFLLTERRRTFLPPVKYLLVLGALGVILALHWWTFFCAIQVSTVAIGLLGYAAFPLFVTFLEPLLFKEKLRSFDIVTALAVMIGLAIVAWPFEFHSGRTAGVLWGILSGLLFAVLSVINRKYVQHLSSLVMACFQNAFACLSLMPIIIGTSWQPTWSEIGLLAILGTVCTALAHAMFIYSLRVVRAQLAGVVAAMEPVYGILFAFVLLGEIPQKTTLLGGILIIGTTCAAILRRQSAISTPA